MFVRENSPFEEQSFDRVVRRPLDDAASARLFDITTAEDIILHKLEWFRLGEEVSERQWKDVVGVIAVQGQALDLVHLRRWSKVLGLEELLERALAEGAAITPA